MVEFIKGDEREVINNPVNAPTTAFVIAESEKGYMLLYNKYRYCWEITGGCMEKGETPRDCAIRECLEESGQSIARDNLQFIGVAKYESMNAAIYYSFLECEAPFVENEEISALRWWKMGEEIEKMDIESLKLIEIYKSGA